MSGALAAGGNVSYARACPGCASLPLCGLVRVHQEEEVCLVRTVRAGRASGHHLK